MFNGQKIKLKDLMKPVKKIIAGLLPFLLVASVLASEPNQETDFVFEVAKDAINIKDIYYGAIPEPPNNKIKNPRCVKIMTLIQNTQQYKELKKKKLKKEDAKYWLLLASASDNVYRQISEYGKKHNNALICEQDPLLSVVRQNKDFKSKNELEIISRFDITQQVLSFSKNNGEKQPNLPN